MARQRLAVDDGLEGQTADAGVARERLDDPLGRDVLQAFGLIGRNIEEIECGRLRRQFVRELPAEIGIDLDDGDQQRDAETEGKHDRRRQRARPVDVGDRHAQAR